MARKVVVRVSYQHDARYLNTLIEAVEKDPKMGISDKRMVISKLGDVVVFFTQQAGRNLE